ncbi:class I SAM-dependent methyltransferase [Fimbriiglobus ruber]|uniref:Methyltransferase type 11 n=1 Tax=Fimbriiglobus ruber TaxID=1908690 RepID=A0A225E6L2_9BACT|nr:class I SAM-dependent methyltransferase [Fimbriiglobus ruber]OWK45139.1 Methyltransferase type 11 [Fimbriiglobus ruber]
MTLTADRLTSEQAFHDRQAAERAATFRDRADLRFGDDDYLGHESWVRPAFAALGDVRGKAVLDYGCGHGMAAVVLARRGAAVTAFDLSPGYVREAEARAAANSVAGTFVVADGERLPFPDASFDAVWGNAVLHHLDLAVAGAELARVLKPGGVAVFCEPWGGNPVLEFARRHLPYPSKDRTPDEQPLRPRDLAPLRRVFPGLRVDGHQFFAMIGRVWKHRRVAAALGAADARLLRWAPGVGNWCRYVVITLPKG